MNSLISYIIPVYNEKNSIKKTIEDVYGIGKIIGRKFQIIVVNDGSNDGTGSILDNMDNITVINHNINQGYGAALKTGIKKASGDLIAIVDADRTYPIDMFPELFKELESFDMAVGARCDKIMHMPFFRRIAHGILGILNFMLTGKKIPDFNSGMRVFKKEIADRFFKLFPDGFSFTTTITIAALCNGYSVKYIPINYYKREGKSTIHPIKDFLGFFQLIVRLAVYFKPLNVFGPMSILFFIVGIIKMSIDAIRLSHFGIGGVSIVLLSMQILFLGLMADLIIKRTDL